jgi:hypothetical protein
LRRIKVAMASACPWQTSSLSCMHDCATRLPDTNRTAHGRHTALNNAALVAAMVRFGQVACLSLR